MKYTLKSLLFVALMAAFFACQENDEEIKVIEDQQSQVVLTCPAGACAGRVTIWSDRFVRWTIINNALAKFTRTRPDLASVIAADRSNYTVVPIGGNNYNVTIPLEVAEVF
ncbi:MAG: hypothetical protein AAGA66_12015 [Bacteroidota bacterium]